MNGCYRIFLRFSVTAHLTPVNLSKYTAITGNLRDLLSSARVIAFDFAETACVKETSIIYIKKNKTLPCFSCSFSFCLSAFQKSIKVGGQEYALQLVDTAGQVRKFDLLCVERMPTRLQTDCEVGNMVTVLPQQIKADTLFHFFSLAGLFPRIIGNVNSLHPSILVHVHRHEVFNT